MTLGPKRLDEWLKYVARLHPSEIELGLERVLAVADELDLHPPPGRVVIVAGTNGKGSTASLIAAALRIRAGLRTALYLSPYVQEFGERVQIDGAHAADEELCREFERVEAVRGDIRLTEFEFVTLASLGLFSRAKCESWVLEVGLGGRLDAVNVIDPDVSVITRIAMDHQDWLGNTLDEIAAEKAGILRPGKPALYGAGPAPRPIKERAGELGAPLREAGADFDFEPCGDTWNWRGAAMRRNGLPTSAPAGAAEFANASLALAVLEQLNPDWTPDRTDYAAIREAARLPGRFERIESAGVEWVLDVAHNPDAAACLARSLAALPPRPAVWVLGMYADKDAEGFLDSLPIRQQDRVIATRADGPKARPAEELAAAAALRKHPNLELGATVIEACEHAARLAKNGDRVVITGSFSTVGPARTWLQSTTGPVRNTSRSSPASSYSP